VRATAGLKGKEGASNRTTMPACKSVVIAPPYVERRSAPMTVAVARDVARYWGVTYHATASYHSRKRPRATRSMVSMCSLEALDGFAQPG
jgi:hypothetical protein